MVRTGGKREIRGKDSKSPAEFVKEIGGVFFRMVPDGAEHTLYLLAEMPTLP